MTDTGGTAGDNRNLPQSREILKSVCINILTHSAQKKEEFSLAYTDNLQSGL